MTDSHSYLPTPSTAPPRERRLKGWQTKFALWYSDAHHPSKAEQLEVASRLAGRRISYSMLRTLKARPDWQELLIALEKGGIEAARNIFVADMPLYAELHRWGAERAREKDDPRAIPSFTVPILDRALPKQEPLFQVAQQINVSLSDRQRTIHDSLPIEVTAEPIEPEPSRAPLPPMPKSDKRWVDERTGKDLSATDAKDVRAWWPE